MRLANFSRDVLFRTGGTGKQTAGMYNSCCVSCFEEVSFLHSLSLCSVSQITFKAAADCGALPSFLFTCGIRKQVNRLLR